MSSSTIALIMAVLLLLQMHACTARHSSHLLSFTKLQDADKTKLVHYEVDINGFPVFKDVKESSSEEVSSGTVDRNARLVMEMQDVKGKPRAMLESSKTKEATDANEGEPVEDAAADEDYVQTHRRSPIHNHH